MTEHGLGERENSCTFVFWLLSHKISEGLRKNNSDPSDYVESL